MHEEQGLSEKEGGEWDRSLKGTLPAFLRSLDFTLLAVEVLHHTITFVEQALLATVCQMD